MVKTSGSQPAIGRIDTDKESSFYGLLPAFRRLAQRLKLLAEARKVYAEGAPAPLPEEKADADKYRDRIARLRQTVTVHEKNVEALKKEIASIR